MKLGRKNIGQLFDVQGSDGSWVYQLVAVEKGELLFYSFNGNYYREPKEKYSDWRRFKGQPWSKDLIQYGWSIAKEK